MNLNRQDMHEGAANQRLLRPIALLAFIVCLSGCGHQTIEGTVMLDGQPLQEGYITFLPQKETEGAGAGTKIQEGKFLVEAPDEPLQGSYRVEITAKGKTGRKTVDGSGQRRESEGQILPKRYNADSTLTAEIKPEEAKPLTFELTSK